MTRFIEGDDRFQATLFPDQLDDYIAEDNPVRIVDVFVDELDLGNMGFRTVPSVTGRPAYNPAMMLKLYIYGYLNRIQSSRRLERESGRNVELMWLLGRLAPDFKTIADFRKDNTCAICTVCREFVLLCRQLDLFTDNLVAIDGSKFKAVNHRDKNFTRAKLKNRLKTIDESIEKYLLQIEQADYQTKEQASLTKENLGNKITKLKAEIEKLNQIEDALEATDDKQISLVDPDARSMKKSGGSLVGYNVQAAVDCKNHLIITHDVTNIGNDRSQLHRMAETTKTLLETDALTALADKGYYNGEEILACEQSNIDAILPKPQTSGNKAKGMFDKSAFTYNPETDSYRCPAGEDAIYRFCSVDKGKNIKRYWSSSCTKCPLKDRCTTGEYRRISRWEHEEVLDKTQARLLTNPEAMITRKSTVEHPFGTIKSWMGATHFQMKTLKKVRAEMSLHVLAYNMKRVINIIGTGELIKAMQA